MTNIEFERPPPIDAKFRSHNHLLAKFTVDAFDKDGRYLGRTESRENDLLLNNFGTFFTNIFIVPIAGVFTRFSTMIARGGAGVTLTTYNSGPTSAGAYFFGLLSITAQSLGTYVGTGTSTTAPARADTDLTALLTVASATGANYSTTSNQVVASGANTISNAATVNEAGIYLMLQASGAGVAATLFLMAHDLVSPGVSVPSMGTASVNWALQI